MPAQPVETNSSRPQRRKARPPPPTHTHATPPPPSHALEHSLCSKYLVSDMQLRSCLPGCLDGGERERPGQCNHEQGSMLSSQSTPWWRSRSGLGMCAVQSRSWLQTSLGEGGREGGTPSRSKPHAIVQQAGTSHRFLSRAILHSGLPCQSGQRCLLLHTLLKPLPQPEHNSLPP